jgi:hypothetical protein
MIAHLSALLQSLLDAGLAIESLTADGQVQPPELQKAADLLIATFDDSDEAEQKRQQVAVDIAQRTDAKALLSDPATTTDHALTGLVKALVDQLNTLRDAVGLKPVTIETLTAAVSEKIDSAVAAQAEPMAADAI